MFARLEHNNNTNAFAWAEISAALLLLLLLASGCTAAAPSATASSGEPPRVVTAGAPATLEATFEVASEAPTPPTPRPSETCAPANLADASEIVIGVLLPSSLPNSLPTALTAQSGLVLGLEEWRAMAAPEFPAIRLWWGDSANDPDLAASLAEEAIVRQCAVALISASNSETNAAIDAVAQRWSKPLIIVDGMDDTLTASQSETLFRLTPNNSMIADAYAGWMSAVGDFNGDGVTHATLVIENNDWAKMQAQLIAEAMWAKQIEVEVYPVDLPATDYSSLIARLVVKSALPDALFIRLSGEAGILLHRQLLENGVGPTRKSLIVAARSMADMPAFWDVVGESGAWSVAVRSGAWHGTVDGASQTLVSEYARLYGRWPEMAAFAAHDALLLLTDAMQRADSLAGSDLIGALEQSDISLAGGHYTFGSGGADGDGQPAWQWHQWLGQPILFMQLTAAEQALDDAAVLWPPAYAATEEAFLRPIQ